MQSDAGPCTISGREGALIMGKLAPGKTPRMCPPRSPNFHAISARVGIFRDDRAAQIALHATKTRANSVLVSCVALSALYRGRPTDGRTIEVCMKRKSTQDRKKILLFFDHGANFPDGTCGGFFWFLLICPIALSNHVA